MEIGINYCYTVEENQRFYFEYVRRLFFPQSLYLTMTITLKVPPYYKDHRSLYKLKHYRTML